MFPIAGGGERLKQGDCSKAYQSQADRHFQQVRNLIKSREQCLFRQQHDDAQAQQCCAVPNTPGDSNPCSGSSAGAPGGNGRQRQYVVGIGSVFDTQ